MRLDRLLANSGHGSRKEVKALIRTGRLSLHGQVLKKADFNIAEEDFASLLLDGSPLNPQLHFYYLLHKPAGYLSAMEDRRHACVATFLPEEVLPLGLFPVGRLDLDTTGLLLFTNDGQLGHRLCSPEWGIWKTYLFTYDGLLLSEKEVQQVQDGLQLDGFTCLPAKLECLDGNRARLQVQEGKFHQVKRMVQALGREVTQLKRERQGPLSLVDLPEPGQIRPLYEAELDALYECVKLDRPAY